MDFLVQQGHLKQEQMDRSFAKLSVVPEQSETVWAEQTDRSTLMLIE